MTIRIGPAGGATWTRRGAHLATVGVGLLLLAPVALGSLTGSGQIQDVVQLSTTAGSIASAGLSSTGGSPAGGSSFLEVTNANSNVDTFLRLDWGSSPYHGASPSQTSIGVRGTTHLLADLLFFQQETVTGTGSPVASAYYSPLVLKNSGGSARVTWTSVGNACAAWSGTPAGGFSATAAGTFTFKYHLVASPADDAPATSDTFYYCLDTTNAQVYIGKSASFASGTLLKSYTDNSALGTVKSYQYQFLSGSQTAGNRYCLVGTTGSGTSATPNLLQCMRMTYSSSGSSKARLYPLFDPPAFFPSANQAGGASVTFSIAGIQWNPFAHTETNSA